MVVDRDVLTSRPPDHVVNVYDDDKDIVGEVSRLAIEGLRSDTLVVVVATQVHRDAVDEVLLDDGVDISLAQTTGRYISLDAAETLSRFTGNGIPDPRRFQEVIGTLIAAAESTGRPVWVFGEMVALLWADGNLSGAIELEGMWNDLARDHRFSLYCAYPLALLAASDDLGATGQVCTHHTAVIPPSSYESDVACVPDEHIGQISRLFVPAAPACRAVRRFVSDTLTAWSHEDLQADAALVASELAANAVQHANSPFRIRLRREESSVHIALYDISRASPLRRHPTPTETGGRGMALVELLSTEWGTHHLPEGKVVWSRLAI